MLIAFLGGPVAALMTMSSSAVNEGCNPSGLQEVQETPPGKNGLRNKNQEGPAGRRQDTKKEAGKDAKEGAGQEGQKGTAGQPPGPRSGGSLLPSKTEPMTAKARERMASRRRCVDELVQGKLSAAALAEFLPCQRVGVPKSCLDRLALALQNAYGGGRIHSFHFNALLTRLRNEMVDPPMAAKGEADSALAMVREWKDLDATRVTEILGAYREVYLHSRRSYVSRRLLDEPRIAIEKLRVLRTARDSGSVEDPDVAPDPTAADLLWIWGAEDKGTRELGEKLATELTRAWAREGGDPDRVVDVILEVAGWIHDAKRKRMTGEERTAELTAVLTLAGFGPDQSTELAKQGRKLVLAVIKSRKGA